MSRRDIPLIILNSMTFPFAPSGLVTYWTPIRGLRPRPNPFGPCGAKKQLKNIEETTAKVNAKRPQLLGRCIKIGFSAVDGIQKSIASEVRRNAFCCSESQAETQAVLRRRITMPTKLVRPMPIIIIVFGSGTALTITSLGVFTLDPNRADVPSSALVKYAGV